MTGRWPRIAVVALGAWLFVSAFAWPHSNAQFTNAWLSGVAAIAIALLSLAVPRARFFNTALGVWLFLSAFTLPSMDGSTIWNHAAVGVAIFALSLVPGEGRAGPFAHRRRVTV